MRARWIRASGGTVALPSTLPCSPIADMVGHGWTWFCMFAYPARAHIHAYTRRVPNDETVSNHVQPCPPARQPDSSEHLRTLALRPSITGRGVTDGPNSAVSSLPNAVSVSRSRSGTSRNLVV